MNNPSPLIPQGSLLEQKNRSRSRVKIAFFAVVGVHVAAILIALLAQGCKRETEPPVVEPTQPTVPIVETNLPPMDTNALPGATEITNPEPVAVPAPEPVPVQVPAPTTQEYSIQKGDTFGALAAKFHVSIKALQAANPNVNPTRLQINQKITIPAPSAPKAAATGETTGADTGAGTYVVKPGDNLTKIAKQHGTTIAAIQKANNLRTTKIKAGQKLKLPAAAVSAPPSSPAAVPTPVPGAVPDTGAPQ